MRRNQLPCTLVLCRIIGDSAREQFRVTTLSLNTAQANLSAAYTVLVSGLGAQLCHHCMQGQ